MYGKYAVEVHCAAHTVELCVKAIVRNCLDTSAGHVIEKSREMVKKLRTENISNLMSLRGLPKADIDSETRWENTHEMLISLLRLKDFCIELSLANTDFEADNGFWTTLEEVTNILKHPAATILKLQEK